MKILNRLGLAHAHELMADAMGTVHAAIGKLEKAEEKAAYEVAWAQNQIERAQEKVAGCRSIQRLHGELIADAQKAKAKLVEFLG